MALTKVSRGLLSTSIVDNGNATAITIDSSENVGIGTSSPANTLDVLGDVYSGAFYRNVDVTSVGPAGSFIQVGARSGSTRTPAAAFGSVLDNPATTGSAIIQTLSGGSLTERMRIDSSGNLMVGKTAIGSTVDGFEARASGYTALSDTSGAALNVNRNTTDGNIVTFTKDGTTVGSIGAISSQTYIGSDDITGLIFHKYPAFVGPRDASDPTAVDDGNVSLGWSNQRFKDLYRSGSTYSTSDRNMKQDIRDLTDAERNVAVACKGLLKAFRFIDAVEKDGDDANIHFGVIAQELEEAFKAEGLDANDYQVYKSATTTDEDGNEQTRLNVCYENLLAFIIAAI